MLKLQNKNKNIPTNGHFDIRRRDTLKEDEPREKKKKIWRAKKRRSQPCVIFVWKIRNDIKTQKNKTFANKTKRKQKSENERRTEKQQRKKPALKKPKSPKN